MNGFSKGQFSALGCALMILGKNLHHLRSLRLRFPFVSLWSTGTHLCGSPIQIRVSNGMVPEIIYDMNVLRFAFTAEAKC